MFGKKKAKELSVSDKIAEIRALGTVAEKKKRKDKDVDTNAVRINKLLEYARDINPECRIAAVEELGKTSNEMAITCLLKYVSEEKNEKVLSAMKAALSSMKANRK